MGAAGGKSCILNTRNGTSRDGGNLLFAGVAAAHGVGKHSGGSQEEPCQGLCSQHGQTSDNSRKGDNDGTTAQERSLLRARAAVSLKYLDMCLPSIPLLDPGGTNTTCMRGPTRSFNSSSIAWFRPGTSQNGKRCWVLIGVIGGRGGVGVVECQGSPAVPPDSVKSHCHGFSFPLAPQDMNDMMLQNAPIERFPPDSVAARDSTLRGGAILLSTAWAGGCLGVA